MATQKQNQAISDLLPDTIIEVFEVDGGPRVGWRFFHAGKIVDKDIVLGGQTYECMPIEADGFESKGDGTLARPRLVVANPKGVISGLIKREDDLVGNKFIRKRIFLKFLDSVNFPENANPFASPDPDARFDDDMYVFNRKVTENKYYVEFELMSPLEVENYKLPARIMIANYCPWRYRGEGCRYGARPNMIGPMLNVVNEANPGAFTRSQEMFRREDDTSKIDLSVGGFPVADENDKRFTDYSNGYGLSTMKWCYTYNPTFVSLTLSANVTVSANPTDIPVNDISWPIPPSRSVALFNVAGDSIGSMVLTQRARSTVTVKADLSSTVTVGSGKTVTIDLLRNVIESGEKVTFSGGGVLTLTRQAAMGSKVLKGTLATASVTDDETGTAYTTVTGNVVLDSGASLVQNCTGTVGYVKGDVVMIPPASGTSHDKIPDVRTVDPVSNEPPAFFVCIKDHTTTQDPRFKKEYWVEDQCSKTLVGCNMRFSAERYRPFGGFPSVEAYRYTN